MKQRILLIDGNNQFFIHYQKATSFNDLVRRLHEITFGYDAVYWVFDGFDSRAKRREIYPEYKVTKSRLKSSQDRDKYELLNKFKTESVPALGSSIQIEIPKHEADDIIRILCQELNGNNKQITIASNDADLLDMMSENIIQPQATLPKFVTQPWELILYKTLVGDSGDNIKGLKGFGDKAWENTEEATKSLIYSALATGRDHPPLGISDTKLLERLKEQWSELKMYWSVVNYIPVDPDVLIKNMKVHPVKPNISKTFQM